jgi:hypothetical protein
MADVVSWFFQSMGICFTHFIFSTSPTNKRNKVLNQGTVGAKDHEKLRGYQKHRTVLPNLHVPYEQLQYPAGKHHAA